MRTISEPALASSNACLAVRSASAVSVLVIDCTRIGAPPPISLSPIRTRRVLCLGKFVMVRSFQYQPCDLDRDVRLQVYRIVVIGESHGSRIADYQRQRRLARHDSPGPRQIELRHQRSATAVRDFHPGLAVEFESNAPNRPLRLQRLDSRSY